MRIPIKDDMIFPAYHVKQAGEDYPFIKTDENNDREADSFEGLLRDVIETIEKRGTFSIERNPLDEKKLQKLVEMVQAEMSNLLFSVVTNNEDKSDFLKTHGSLFNLFPAGNLHNSSVSKIRQGHHKEDLAHSRDRIDDIIDHASKKYNVDSDLVRAVVQAESDFNTTCTSSKGAMGLMQLMPETAKELGVKNAYNPVENIMGGTRYLKSLLERYDGNIPLALAAYNWGMGNVERHPGKLPQETRTYIARINQFYREQSC